MDSSVRATQAESEWIEAPAPLMGDDGRKRVLTVVCQIPEGRWITYGKLAELSCVATVAHSRVCSLQTRRIESPAGQCGACASFKIGTDAAFLRG